MKYDPHARGGPPLVIVHLEFVNVHTVWGMLFDPFDPLSPQCHRHDDEHHLGQNGMDVVALVMPSGI